MPPIEASGFIASLPVGGPNGRRCFNARLETPQKPVSPPPPNCPPCQHNEYGVCVDDTPPPCSHCDPSMGWIWDCQPGQVCSNGICVTPSPGGGGGDGGGGGGDGGGGDGGGGGGPWVGVPWLLGNPIGPPWQPGPSGGCIYYPSEVYASSPVWLVVVTNVTASVKIRLDSNNDRQLTEDDDAVKTNSAFRFWVNNDHDVASLDFPAGQDRPSGNDSADKEISCVRDLEDFAQLQIEVDASTLDLIQNHGYRVALVSTGPQVNVFPAYQPGTAYLTDMDVATNQVRGGQVHCGYGYCGFGCCFVPNPPSFYSTAQDLNNLTITNLLNFFLFEGKSAGAGELRVEIRGPVGNLVTNDAAKIEIKNVQDLYEKVEAVIDTTIPNSTPSSWVPLGPSVASFPRDSTNAIVFVHGWNNDDWYKSLRGGMLVKRLYWQGFDGKIVGFRWPTYAGVFAPLLYNESEYRAFKSGQSLADFLMTAPSLAGYKVSIFSHSMGNIVAGEALRQLPASIVSYAVFTQAAAPAHCYDPRDDLNLPDFVTQNANFPTPDSYRGWFAAIDRKLRAKAANFYNPVDYALTIWWWADQMYNKPTRPSYAMDNGVPKFGSGVFARVITQNCELMSMVSRPNSHALAVDGRTGETGVGCVIPGLNLQDSLGFDHTEPDHSGQFNRPYQQVWQYFEELWRRFKE